MNARKSVLRQYAAEHDRFSEEEQLLVGMGDYVKAEGAHWYAQRVVQAYRAELDDPKPPVAQCHICRGDDTCDKAYHLSVRIGL